jgi:hypothetical protein
MTAFEPAHESPARRMKKLVVIHYDPEMIALGMRMFGKTCDIPKGILRVRSLEDAKKIVDEHRPDIVLVGKRIGNSPDGCYELLEYAKLQNPDAKVVLWSGILRGDERREGAKCHYDAIVPRRDLNGIREAVGQFSG